MASFGTGSDNDLLCQHLFITLFAADDNSIAGISFSGKRAPSLEKGDLVFAEKELHSGSHFCDNSLLALLHSGNIINAYACRSDAMIRKVMHRFFEGFRRGNKCFQWNTSGIETGAAKPGFICRIVIGVEFTAGHRKTKLCGTDGGNISAGTCTDNKNVELFVHGRVSF